jgi:hypothetical protein
VLATIAAFPTSAAPKTVNESWTCIYPDPTEKSLTRSTRFDVRNSGTAEEVWRDHGAEFRRQHTIVRDDSIALVLAGTYQYRNPFGSSPAVVVAVSTIMIQKANGEYFRSDASSTSKVDVVPATRGTCRRE